jgi:hypothetical protein
MLRRVRKYCTTNEYRGQFPIKLNPVLNDGVGNAQNEEAVPLREILLSVL